MREREFTVGKRFTFSRKFPTKPFFIEDEKLESSVARSVFSVNQFSQCKMIGKRIQSVQRCSINQIINKPKMINVPEVLNQVILRKVRRF